MSTLETQYKTYQSENPDSTLSFDEWKKEHGIKMKGFLTTIIENINSDEYKQSCIKKNEERLKNMNVYSELGYYVGEHIVDNNLPTLSTNMLHSRKVIQVSEEDTVENKRLSDEWFSTTRYQSNYNGDLNGDKEKWELYYQHNKMLEKKYLPPVLECVIGLIRIDDMKEFKSGLINSLWGCDMCSYSLKEDDIDIENDLEMGITKISFRLSQ